MVVGLPRSLSGREGPAAVKVREFAAGWRRVAPVPVRLCDERLTTVSAEAMLRDRGRKGAKRRAVVDQAAAVVILQHALDTERATGPRPGEIVEETDDVTRAWTSEDEDDEADLGRDPGGPGRRRAAAQPQGLPRGARRGGGPGRRRLLLRGHQGRRADPGPVLRRRGLRGPGRGKVTFEVHEGDSLAEMGRNLKKQGVVASGRGVHRGGRRRPASTGIQVGFYGLQKEMPAADALEVLVDPDNILKNTVTVPEGLRVADIVDVLADKTDFSKASSRRCWPTPTGSGCPTTPTATPRATCSRRRTTSAEGQARSRS